MIHFRKYFESHTGAGACACTDPVMLSNSVRITAMRMRKCGMAYLLSFLEVEMYILNWHKPSSPAQVARKKGACVISFLLWERLQHGSPAIFLVVFAIMFFMRPIIISATFVLFFVMRYCHRGACHSLVS